jgi:hypothetical protein
MALLRKLLPVAGMIAMRRYGPRYGPAALLMGAGRLTLPGLVLGYFAKKIFDKAMNTSRVRRAY